MSNSYLIKQSFKGTIVNRDLQSLPEATRTIPLIYKVTNQNTNKAFVTIQWNY